MPSSNESGLQENRPSHRRIFSMVASIFNASLSSTDMYIERNKKRADLERVNQLDGKMTIEISQLSMRLAELRTQIYGLSNIKETRDRAVQEKTVRPLLP